MNFNKVIIAGNLTRDPDLKYLDSGKSVCNFSIAVNDKYKKGDEYVENVSFLDIVVFAKQAENCTKYLTKGKPVLVEGKLQQRSWDAKDGTKRSKIEIMASNVQFLDTRGSGSDAGSSTKVGESAFDKVSDDDIPF